MSKLAQGFLEEFNKNDDNDGRTVRLKGTALAAAEKWMPSKSSLSETVSRLILIADEHLTTVEKSHVTSGGQSESGKSGDSGKPSGERK